MPEVRTFDITLVDSPLELLCILVAGLVFATLMTWLTRGWSPKPTGLPLPEWPVAMVVVVLLAVRTVLALNELP